MNVFIHSTVKEEMMLLGFPAAGTSTRTYNDDELVLVPGTLVIINECRERARAVSMGVGGGGLIKIRK